MLARQRRIEGQVRGIHRMVEDDGYCVDIPMHPGPAWPVAKRIGDMLMSESG